MKTIAQQIKWDFNINGELIIKDKNGKLIYAEDSDGNWGKFEYDSQDNLIYCEDSKGNWEKCEYDSQDNLIYCEYSNGNWEKFEYDSQGNEIYYEDSTGEIKDNRPKPCENKIVEIDGEKFKLVKI